MGSWRWNIYTALAGALLIFLLSFTHNPIITVLMRTGLSFIVLFFITFVVRWMLGEVFLKTENSNHVSVITSLSKESPVVGQKVDLSTPEDIFESGKSDFSPLRPTRLVTKVTDQEAERLAQSIRRMSE
jgi:hypothetical protein